MMSMLGVDLPQKMALAVSGGGDSMALLYLAADWARLWQVDLSVVTIDHQLRRESGAEAALVKAVSQDLGLTHTTLLWQGWNGQGNLPDAARRARLDLINGWRREIRYVLMGHTLDDQAETFLMRLRRGSGVDGLSGIAPVHLVTVSENDNLSASSSGLHASGSLHVLRPLLAVSRANLRAHLTKIGASWVDDPSNQDDHYERVRMRQFMPDLEAVGLYQKGLADTAKRLRRARTALSRRAVAVAEQIAHQDDGDVVFDLEALGEIEEETQLRLLAAALCWVSSNAYRPRLTVLENALQAALVSKNGALHGGLIRVHGTQLRITREYQAVRDTRHIVGNRGFWDGRWQITGPKIDGTEIRPLGPEGVQQIGTAWQNRPNYAIILSKPGIFRDNQLIACQSAGFGPAYEQQIQPSSFTSLLIEH